MGVKEVSFELSGNKEVTLSSGKLASFANGSCTVQLGETIVFSAACSGPAREKPDFFPLQVDYREKFSASGMFPGGYIKREGRPSDKEILICRMADRPLRPLFPKGFFNEVQVQSMLLSCDMTNGPDVLSILGASVSLTLSDLPFQGPIGAVRVGLVDDKFIANPTNEELERSSLDLVYAGLPDKVIMVEGDAQEISEEKLRDAMEFANEQVKIQVDAQLKLAEKAGRQKKDYSLITVPEQIKKSVSKYCKGKLEELCFIHDKEERSTALNEVFENLKSEIYPDFSENYEEDDFEYYLKSAFEEEVKSTIRKGILYDNKRSDGRHTDELRPIETEAGYLPRTHGSALFSRGETQALVITTLGSPKDVQEKDSITSAEPNIVKQFYLHYNFPNYSVGETGRIMGPGRREIGHGNLAERSIAQLVPEDNQYTVRCVSEIMASNGSTSMASVCGASLSLMDAGIQLREHVAGISCGLVSEGESNVLLTDIIGSEDHFGDMDFKIAGTTKGITGFQLDLKLPGIGIDMLYEGMQRNKDARLKIIDKMNECISGPREELSPHAPRIKNIKVNPDKVGSIIGPSGKTIKRISELTGAKIDVQNDGIVNIFTSNKSAMDEAVNEIEALIQEPEIGKIYRGVVKNVKDFGVFVEFIPGTDGFVHISELADYRIRKVDDICEIGDKMSVKVIDIDDRGRVRLSRKQALKDLD